MQNRIHKYKGLFSHTKPKCAIFARFDNEVDFIRRIFKMFDFEFKAKETQEKNP